MYYEFFVKINETNTDANFVRDAAGLTDAQCKYPNLFAVTNFDGFNPELAAVGAPNFADWPVKAHSNKLALGIGPHGIFRRMTVEATKYVVKASTVIIDDEEDEDVSAPIATVLV
jgi:hypothetical protein